METLISIVCSKIDDIESRVIDSSYDKALVVAALDELRQYLLDVL